MKRSKDTKGRSRYVRGDSMTEDTLTLALLKQHDLTLIINACTQHGEQTRGSRNVCTVTEL